MMTPSDIWDVVRGRKAIVPSHGDVLRGNQISPTNLGPNPIVPNMHYFGIVVDELFHVKIAGNGRLSLSQWCYL